MRLREIKAYVRPGRIDFVVNGLRAIGIDSISVITVDGVGGLVDPVKDRVSLDYGSRISKVHKLELVCWDGDEDEIVQTILEEARTGEPGDGVIFVTDVGRAVKIRTGREGRAAIQGSETPPR